MKDQLGRSDRIFCYILMPFSKEYEEIYELSIKPACSMEDVYCERADETQESGIIIDRIYNQISKADLVIAEMTGENPNVFYEVGYAHALGKRVVLIAQDADAIPFDLAHYFHIIYKDKVDLQRRITSCLQYYKSHPETNLKLADRRLEIYINNELLREDKEYNVDSTEFQVSIHNPSPYTYPKSSFRIGFVTDSTYLSSEDTERVIRMPNGFYMHMLPMCDDMFPLSWESYKFSLIVNEEDPPEPIELAEFRVFTELGRMDYPLKIHEKS